MSSSSESLETGTGVACVSSSPNMSSLVTIGRAQLTTRAEAGKWRFEFTNSVFHYIE
jgi:hypothetical protein